MRANVSGTFAVIHKGHEALFRAAFENFEEVVIGLTSDGFVKKMRKKAPPYAERERALNAFLESQGRSAEVKKIADVYGFAADDRHLDAIVVSEETWDNAELINAKRVSSGLRPLVVLAIPLVRDSKGRKVSSRMLK
jgi:pantetheine-phosphate adenylyltransferase